MPPESPPDAPPNEPEQPPRFSPPNLPNPPMAPPSPPRPTDHLTFSQSEDLMEPGEKLLAVVHRHPIGIFFVYLEALAGVIAIIALFVTVAPETFQDLTRQGNRWLVAGIIFGLAALIFFLFVATYVYRLNRILITDRSLVEISQRSLFLRRISRLNFENVEDVTAAQLGILSTIFNYGTLTVQTAGTLENFIFKYCPNPNKYADIIVEARRAYLQNFRVPLHD
ncbi:TPA: hypothetical protein DIS56_00310 [Candidatus Saccharibacteria bacterium]|nr:MAG: hypothetical protein UX30_C0002G0048 [Candidatus Saccharibacteria bacterium GW2011_GWA2_46_10]OGL35778.1 MAG: hypothetical protein A3F05_01935 [Candidatus Saccharibacteria bacterium RIFCSPHIGHO2_12_FULL_47_17]HCM51571.1 hypothetical protein [Candidatus Saccharibacteria bacterium]